MRPYIFVFYMEQGASRSFCRVALIIRLAAGGSSVQETGRIIPFPYIHFHFKITPEASGYQEHTILGKKNIRRRVS